MEEMPVIFRARKHKSGNLPPKILMGVSFIFFSLFLYLSPALSQSTPGDLNADGKVDVLDLGILLSNWSSGDAACPEPCRGDINGDGIVNVLDLGILLSHWGQGATQLPSEPGRPIQFSVQSQTATHAHIGVSWGAASNATDYTYTSGLNGGSGWSGQNGTTQSTSVTLSSVPNGASIWFCVRARNSAGESVNECSSFIVPGGSSPPPPPPPPPPSGSEGAGPNEPAGFIRWAEHDFSCTPGATGCDLVHGVATNALWGNYSVIADAEASNGRALRIRYPEGMDAGVSPGRFFVRDPNGGAPLKEWYISLHIKLEGSDWEWPPAAQKLWYNGIGNGVNANRGGSVQIASPGTLVIDGGSRQLRTTWRESLESPAQVAWSASAFEVGRWHHVEFHGIASTPDIKDGRLRVWIDGRLVEDVAVMNQSTPDWTTGFYRFDWAPVFGGVCSAGCPKTRDDYMRLGHLYISGVQQ